MKVLCGAVTPATPGRAGAEAKERKMCKCGITGDSFKYIRSIKVIEPGMPFATPFIFYLCEICEKEKIQVVKADPAFNQPNQWPSSSHAVPFAYPTRDYVVSIIK